jgi:hypothetical protein
VSESSEQTLRRLRRELPRRRREAAHLRRADARLHARMHAVGGRIRRVQAGIRRRELTSRERAVTYARGFNGTTEKPPGSNAGGPITRWEHALGLGAVPWCGVACAAWLRHAGVQGVTWRLASVALIGDDARASAGPFAGWTTDRAKVRPGDLVVLFGENVHVGMVERVGPDGVHTIEGNTSAGSSGRQSNGGGVFRKVRPFADVVGFALVRYP